MMNFTHLTNIFDDDFFSCYNNGLDDSPLLLAVGNTSCEIRMSTREGDLFACTDRHDRQSRTIKHSVADPVRVYWTLKGERTR